MCILFRYSNIFHPNYCKILEIKMKICKLLGCNHHLVLEDLTRKVEVSFFRKFILKKLCRKKEELCTSWVCPQSSTECTETCEETPLEEQMHNLTGIDIFTCLNIYHEASSELSRESGATLTSIRAGSEIRPAHVTTRDHKHNRNWNYH